MPEPAPTPLEAMSFPRRQARTRRFTLGAPRSFSVSSTGERVAFLRSSGAEDPANALWVFDLEAHTERMVVDPARVEAADETELPAEERARRERARELGGGIVAYDCDAGLDAAVFTLGGVVVRADLDTGEWLVMPSVAGAFDPRLSPAGDRIAYAAGNGLHVVDSVGDVRLIGEETEGVSWGAAEFVAAEEMGRTRGFWWAPTGDRLVVQRVDVTPVEEWWISSPVDPRMTPESRRFPAAGSDNAIVDLAIVDLDGGRIDVGWNESGWEYLADVGWTDDGLVLTVQSRDQRELAVLEVEPSTGRCHERHRITDDRWVELVPGVPKLVGARLLTAEDRGRARRLCVDGEPITGDELQIRRVIDAAESGIVVAASEDPTEIHVARIGWDGSLSWITDEPGVHGAVAGGPTCVLISRTLDRDGSEAVVTHHDEPVATIVDQSAPAGLAVDLTLIRSGRHELDTAVLMPTTEPRGPLPVLMDPYGGPHAQRVQKARGLFDTSQWFADQGFAVVVADGRGTPGRGPGFERAVRGDLASLALEDQVVALDEAIAADDRIDPTRVAIRGWSFGGFLAALAVMREPDRFHAAIAGAPVTDWRLYDTHYTERYLGHPDAEPGNYERSGLMADAPSLRRPLMIIHGLADDNVYAAHTLQLSRALLEAGRPHSVLPLSGVTHMTSQEEVAENLLLVQLAFLRESLGVDATT